MLKRIANWLERRGLRRIRRDARGAMSIKEFAVFAVIVFFGFLAGNFVVQLLGISGSDILAQLGAFIVPTLLVYVLWKWLGASAVKKL